MYVSKFILTWNMASEVQIYNAMPRSDNRSKIRQITMYRLLCIIQKYLSKDWCVVKKNKSLMNKNMSYMKRRLQSFEK